MADENETPSLVAFVGADPTDRRPPVTHGQRQASVYDVVAGKIGHNGFLTKEQQQSHSLLPSAPEEALLRRSTIPADFIYNSYDAAGGLSADNRLPGSEMLKAIHTYASDFYGSATVDKGAYDFRTLDETALIAMGILLEEAAREALGENGDMVFVEPEGLEQGLDETKMTKHQIKGWVKPETNIKDTSNEDAAEPDELPAKRRRH